MTHRTRLFQAFCLSLAACMFGVSIIGMQIGDDHARTPAKRAPEPTPADKKRGGGKVQDAAEDFLTALDVTRYLRQINSLAGFKSRYSTSPGCRAAQAFLEKYFTDLGLKVQSREFQIGPGRASNVIAVLPGSQDPEAKGDFVLIGAHYDSIARDANPIDTAPGAEDNASGTAALMELAALFKAAPPKRTVVFVAFAGEEEGLVGSTAYVQSIVASGESTRLRAAMIMDMIAFTEDSDLDILLETLPEFDSLLSGPTSLAGKYTKLRVEKSLKPFGSDHIPFLNAGLPSFLVIENDWDHYPAYHRRSDLPELISPAMARESLRLVASWAHEAANSPEFPPLISQAKLRNDTLILKGDHFKPGARVEIGSQLLADATVQKPSNRGDAAYTQIKVKDARLATLLPADQTVTIRVFQPQTGLHSPPFSFKR